MVGALRAVGWLVGIGAQFRTYSDLVALATTPLVVPSSASQDGRMAAAHRPKGIGQVTRVLASLP